MTGGTGSSKHPDTPSITSINANDAPLEHTIDTNILWTTASDSTRRRRDVGRQAADEEEHPSKTSGASGNSDGGTGGRR